MKNYILLIVFFIIIFGSISPYVFAHETDLPHEEDIQSGRGASPVRWPVVAGGGVVATIVAVLAYKFIIK